MQTKKKHKKNGTGIVLCFLLTFLATGTFLWFIRFPVVQGDSMEPNFHDGGMTVALHGAEPKRGDVVIVWSPDLDEYVIKRIIGLPGDVVEIREGRVWVNGIPLYEAYVKDQGWASNTPDVTRKLLDGEMWLMGDNRLTSKDSREFGPFLLSDLFGVVLFE